MFFIALSLCAISLLFIWLKWNYSYWARKKVDGPQPTYFIGNIGSTLNFSEHFGILTAKWYKNYPEEPYVGFYEMTDRAVLVRDPDLVKDILMTNFESFRSNRSYVSKRFDPLFAANPFLADNVEWKEGRRAMLPLMTQSKLRGVVPVMNEASAELIKYIKSHPTNTNFGAKDLSTRYTTENVVRSTFSIKPDCFKKDEPNEFLEAGKDLFFPTFLFGVKSLTMPFLPKWIPNLIPMPFVLPTIDQWFRNLVHTNKSSRSPDFQSNDLFQTLIQTQKKQEFDEGHLAGYALGIFMDGTETSGMALAYSLYELGRNPQCQEKLHEEIVQIMEKHDGKITYEAIQEMTYLDWVVSEATRINPPAPWSRKVCTKPYTLPKTSTQSEPITISPGTVVTIPILGIHMDPKYYPNPTEFRPERFSEQERNKRPKCTFLTFGDGHRVCLGVRFAILQIKVALAHVVSNFHINLSPQHKPLALESKSVLFYPKDGILLQFDSR